LTLHTSQKQKGDEVIVFIMAYARHSSSDTKNATTAPLLARARALFTASGVAQSSRNIFDPWNSASTGHQRADNRLSGSTSWRDSRNQKLSAQYHGGSTGGKRVSDSVGAGSETFGKDGRKANRGWEKGASGLRVNGQLSIMEAFMKTTNKQPSPTADDTTIQDTQLQPLQTPTEDCEHSYDPTTIPPSYQPSTLVNDHPHQEAAPKKQIFQNLCIYINGTTAPLISDHKLKYLLAQHGARTSIALGRRSVTHVILGNTYNKGGAGGGLAGSKIQKEISRVGGKGIKFVSVEWCVSLYCSLYALSDGQP
jgi:hypothetical protein